MKPHPTPADPVYQPPVPAYGLAVTLLSFIFFLQGFITSLNGIIIPYLKALFDLSYREVMLINTGFFGASVLISLPAGKFLQRQGYKNGLLLSCSVAVAGCFLLAFAAGVNQYPLFLLAYFILACGIISLQVCGLPYVSLLGPPAAAHTRIMLGQAFNALGTTIAPLVGSYLVLSHLPAQGPVKPADLSPFTLQAPYLVFAGVFLLLAGVLRVIQLPFISPGAESGSVTGGLAGRVYTSAWQHRHLVLGTIGIFLYVGAEVALGSFMVNYLGHPEVMGLSEQVAGNYVAYYWGGAMVGRFIGFYLLQYVPPRQVLVFNALLAALLVLVSILSQGPLAMWTMLAVGLCHSIMFPTIFSLALQRLGVHTNQGSGIMGTAVVGGAIVPLLQGLLTDTVGMKPAFMLPVLCYGFIAWYGWRGYRPTD